MDLRTANVTRYILPLREGGSLPALAEADDEFKYVVKFRGAGHGTKALIAELIGGEIARTLGFRVPEIVFLNLDEAFGRTEADEEIQDLLQWSRGLNLGLHFLSGALTFDPVVHKVDGKTASQIVWLDALLTNVDRTIKNTNMLMWHKELWHRPDRLSASSGQPSVCRRYCYVRVQHIFCRKSLFRNVSTIRGYRWE